MQIEIITDIIVFFKYLLASLQGIGYVNSFNFQDLYLLIKMKDNNLSAFSVKRNGVSWIQLQKYTDDLYTLSF